MQARLVDHDKEVGQWECNGNISAFCHPGLGAGEVALSTPCSLQPSDFDSGTLESGK